MCNNISIFWIINIFSSIIISLLISDQHSEGFYENTIQWNIQSACIKNFTKVIYYHNQGPSILQKEAVHWVEFCRNSRAAPAEFLAEN